MPLCSGGCHSCRLFPYSPNRLFSDHLGQIIQQSDYFEPPMVFDNFTETIRHWKNDVETMTRSCYQMDAPVDQVETLWTETAPVTEIRRQTPALC